MFLDMRIWLFPLHAKKKSNKLELIVLLIKNGNNESHYVLNKDFNRLMYSKTKHKDKKHFCMACLQNFTTKEILNNHRERCLLINGTQTAIYEKGTIKFKNFDKLIPIPFKIYADSECFLKKTNIDLSEHAKLYQKHIDNSMGAKLVCIHNRFTLPTKIFTGCNCINDFLKWIFEQEKKTNEIINKHFNKKLKNDNRRWRKLSNL